MSHLPAYVPPEVKAYTKSSSVVKVFKAASAITAGYAVQSTDPTATPPTVEHASETAVVAGTKQFVGIALAAQATVGGDVYVVTDGYCGNAVNDGTDLATVGAALGISATAGKLYASTFAAGEGSANVPPTSVVAYVAEATTGTSGPVIVLGKGL